MRRYDKAQRVEYVFSKYCVKCNALAKTAMLAIFLPVTLKKLGVILLPLIQAARLTTARKFIFIIVISLLAENEISFARSL
jgi:hypothetical protein